MRAVRQELVVLAAVGGTRQFQFDCLYIQNLVTCTPNPITEPTAASQSLPTTPSNLTTASPQRHPQRTGVLGLPLVEHAMKHLPRSLHC